MKNLIFNRMAGFAGIASALLFIISIIGMQSYLASDLADMDAFTQNMVDAHYLMLLYGWPGLLATVLIIPLVYYFYKANSSTSTPSKLLFLITVIGLCFILVGYLFHLALTYFHAPMYQEIPLAQQTSFSLLIKSTIGLQDMFWLSGDLFSFLGIAGLLSLNLRERQFPRWFLLLGVLSGISAALGSFGFIPAFKQFSILSLMFIGGFSLFAVWEITAGVLLIKQKNHRHIHH